MNEKEEQKRYTFLSRVATLWWYSSRKASISTSLDFLCLGFTAISMYEQESLEKKHVETSG